MMLRTLPLALFLGAVISLSACHTQEITFERDSVTVYRSGAPGGGSYVPTMPEGVWFDLHQTIEGTSATTSPQASVKAGGQVTDAGTTQTGEPHAKE